MKNKEYDIVNRFVVLQDPNGSKGWYYVWRESTYTKHPDRGFISKVQAELLCDHLNCIHGIPLNKK